MLQTNLRINIIQNLGPVQGCLIDQGSVADPDPLVRGMDPDPDPALYPDPDPVIIKQI
jgi:hypothetical protein